MNRTEPTQHDLSREQRIRRLREQIGQKLDEISQLYKEPVRCTLIVRSVNHPDGRRDTVMTDEGDIEGPIKALRSLYADPNAEHYDADVSAVEHGGNAT